MTETATPRRRRVPHGTPGTPPTKPGEPEPLVAPETAPDKTPHAAPRPKDAPRTMRDLRLARATLRRRHGKPRTNPLRDGLRLERVPDPSVMVLFGATGDLAHRKVVPALYHLWRTNLLPHEFVLLCLGRRKYSLETLRAEYRASLEKYSRVLPLDEAAWRSFAARIAYERLDFDDADGFDRLATRLEAIEQEQGIEGDGNHLYYLATQPSAFAEIVAQLGRVGPRPRAPRRRLAPDRHREAVRPRPDVGDPPEPRGRQGLPRVAGLPHRPLPREGDGPEPAGLPVRQRDLRADLEPPLHRPRPDHGRRVDRRREPRRVLRGDRREPRHPPEPPAAAAEPRRDGAAGDVRGERAPRREGQGPARGRARWSPTGSGPTSSAASTGPAGSRASRSQGYREEPEVDPESETETFVAARLEIDDWRWAGVPFYLRTGKRLPKRATEIAIQFKDVPHWLFQDSCRGARAEPARDPHPARRGDPAALRRQGPGPRARRPVGEHGLHLRLGVLRSTRPRRTRR